MVFDYSSLSSRIRGREIIKIETVRLKDLVFYENEVELADVYLYAFPVEHYHGTIKPQFKLSTAEDRQRFTDALHPFLKDEAELTIVWYDCDRTPTGRPSTRYGAVKEFAVLTWPSLTKEAAERSWAKITSAYREEITLTKDTDFGALHDYLCETYNHSYVYMLNTSFEESGCGGKEWFINNCRRWFQEGPDDVLKVKIKMDHDNLWLGTHAKYLFFELQNGKFYELCKQLRAHRDEAISRYYDSIPSGGYTGD